MLGLEGTVLVLGLRLKHCHLDLIVQAVDVQHLRDSNRELQINIQILTREIDMVTKGQSKSSRSYNFDIRIRGCR